VENSQPRRTQTTLFQDKYISEISSIYVNGVTRWLSNNFSQLINDSAAILDTNGNGYYIPKDSLLNISISLQLSRTSDGKKPTNARYATLSLDHGVDPLSESYEYAILVATDASSIEAL
jgi:chondroitin-sulfate-ABC endolyase/exolyase